MMNHIVKKLLVVLGMSFLSSVALAADKALIIGVEDYSSFSSPVSNLKGIKVDVGMADEIAQRMGFHKENITHLFDEQATRDNVLNALDNIAKTTSKNDRVFIYYSGHGSQVKDTNGDEEDNLDEVLVLYDKMLLDDDIQVALSKIKSDDMVVLLDACHSGTGTKSIGPNRFSQNSQQVYVKSAGYFGNIIDKNLEVFPDSSATGEQHYISIGAAQDNEQSLATTQGSIFTKSLYESIEEARTSNLPVNWQGIFKATATKIENFPIPATAQSFTPKIEGNLSLLTKQIRLSNGTNQYHGSGATVNRDSIIQMVNQLPKDVKIDASRHLNVGDIFSFTVTSSKPGYLNVISVGADDTVKILFPNKHSTDNYIGSQPVEMPGNGKFKIKAVEPRGDTLVAVFVSDKPLDLQSKGFGSLDDKGQRNDEVFTQISRALLLNTPINKNFDIVSNDEPSQNHNEKQGVIANYVTVSIH